MSATHSGPTGDTQSEKFARTAAAVVGAVFVVVAILGFIPGITTNYSDMTFAGHTSDAKLIGIFEVSVLHNIAHLLLGVVGLACSRRAINAAWYLIVGGIVYALLWIYGLAVGEESSANFVPLNSADNWLHFVLAIGMIALGVVALRRLRGGVGSQSPM